MTDVCAYRPLPAGAPSDVISDVEFLAAIESVKATGKLDASVWDLQNVLGVRAELLRRKARRAFRRGLSTGCICGCRGDFDTTPAGRALLQERRAET